MVVKLYPSDQLQLIVVRLLGKSSRMKNLIGESYYSLFYKGWDPGLSNVAFAPEKVFPK